MKSQTKSRRELVRVQQSELVTDGDGVKIQRSVARGALHTFDPFLLLDEIVSDDAADYIGGFPEHPHRGFETVTYMLEGRMRHRDHMGNEGLLVSGGVQWMTAGRGVIHSEMPEQQHGLLHGFQLWVNLPAAEKMSEPAYREYGPEQIPTLELTEQGVVKGSVKALAGEVTLNGETITGPVTGVTTQPDYLDIMLSAGQSLTLPIEQNKRVLLYVYQGALLVEGDDSGRPLELRQLGMLGEGEKLEIHAEEESRLLLLAGKPLNEPVVNRGPFVMNTREEIEQAIADYQTGRLV